MILVDRIVGYDETTIVCMRKLEQVAPFTDPQGNLPSWAGIELMAQAVAAWSGSHARDAGEPVKLGFLLGSRSYRCNVDTFTAGSELRIEAVRTFHDEDGMGVFACRIDAGDAHAEARLTVFSPTDPSAFLASLA
jgi:predicted hotdog family 3-hydroxylacyl-ACP dehydratase